MWQAGFGGVGKMSFPNKTPLLVRANFLGLYLPRHTFLGLYKVLQCCCFWYVMDPLPKRWINFNLGVSLNSRDASMGRWYIYLQIPDTTFTMIYPVPWRVWDLMYPKTPGFDLEGRKFMHWHRCFYFLLTQLKIHAQQLWVKKTSLQGLVYFWEKITKQSNALNCQDLFFLGDSLSMYKV